MTEHDIAFATIPGAPPPPAPSEEDWAVLVSGRASDWLRAQFLRTVQEDPEAADRLALLLDPGYRAAVAEAGDLIAQPLPAPTVGLVRGDATSAVTREVAVRLRGNLAFLFGGFAALAAGYIIGAQFFWMGFASSLVLFLLFAIDHQATRPEQWLRRYRESGDEAAAEAIEDAIEQARARRTGSR